MAACCRRRGAAAPVAPAPARPAERPARPGARTAEEVLGAFARAEGRQAAEGGSAGAELLHTELPAEHWGVGREQLADFAARVREACGSGGLANPSRAECGARGVPHYDDRKFADPRIGPNMYQVNDGFIKPETRRGDPLRGIPCLSYALQKNSHCGLLCDLFISHAWGEGVFEFTDTVLQAWPEKCGGAYICFLSNPQNMDSLISRLIEKPTDSPFYRVLVCRPEKMLMVANSNVPIHSRLWCVYEAHCARALGISTEVVGEPANFATNARATRAANRAIGSAVKSKRREAAIEAAMDEAADMMDVIAAGIYVTRLQKHGGRLRKATEAAMMNMQRALDVRKASCSTAKDRDAIHHEICGQMDDINAMICELIVADQLERVPVAAEPVKLTWYPGQEWIEGIRALFS